ncbi:MAG: pyruvate kinase [Gammaproteobacteria bacterium]|nr:pyruvate kinase [Gammaproteobacteria bacterium]
MTWINKKWNRRTKIVVTLGPSLDNDEALDQVMAAGANVFRANFSHGSAEEHQQRITAVRAAAERVGREVAIFADLQGPKIRVARFKNDKVTLEPGATFTLDAELAENEGDETRVGITYPQLVNDVSSGDKLLLDDGRLVLNVEKVVDNTIICQVEVGGKLSNNKGINRKGGGLSAEALTEKDKADMKVAIANEVDYIAISFPRSAADMQYARQLITEAGGHGGIIAKIERAEAIPALDEIIKASDAVMVARGDLGVEIGDAELPGVQKQIIDKCRAFDKPVITATQMMESMIHNTIPTRAEVFDVANAVLDITDAVMLSAETATGDHPARVVEAMSTICRGAEKQPDTKVSGHRVECYFQHPDEAIAMATVYVANHLDVKAIISITESGQTPLRMSRIRTDIPIFALTCHIRTARKVCLYRDVYPFYFDMAEAAAAAEVSGREVDRAAIAVLKKAEIVEDGDWVLLTKGIRQTKGKTNTLKVYRVGYEQ